MNQLSALLSQKITTWTMTTFPATNIVLDIGETTMPLPLKLLLQSSGQGVGSQKTSIACIHMDKLPMLEEIRIFNVEYYLQTLLLCQQRLHRWGQRRTESGLPGRILPVYGHRANKTIYLFKATNDMLDNSIGKRCNKTIYVALITE